MFIKIVILLTVTSFLFGCSDSTTHECFIRDQVTLLDEQHINGESYFLVLRIGGWHEKIEHLELYDKAPEFSDCNLSKFDPIDAQSLELNNQYVADVYLKNKKLHIIYQTGDDNSHPHKGLKLKIVATDL